MLDSPQFSRSHWSILPLGEVIELVYGKALPKNQRKPGKVAVYGSNGPVGYHDTAVVNEPTVIVGRKGSAGAIQFVNEACYPIDTTYYIRPRPGIELDIEFTFYLLGHLDLSKLRTVTGVPGLNREDAYKLSIGLPPISEQRRIVDILKRADGIHRLRKQAIQTARELIPALFVDMFGKQQHPILRLGDVADVVSGVTKGRRFNGQKTVVVPYLRVANVQAGHLDLSEIKTVEVLPTDVERLVLRKGDVLLTEGGDYDKLGRGALWDHEIENCIHQNHIFRVRADRSKLDPVYFANFLQTQSARLYFLRSAKRTTNLASINMTQLRNLPVPVPPLPDQENFVAHANDVKSIERQHKTAELREDQLFKSMLHRAFRGEL